MPSPRSGKLGLISGVYIPVCLNVISILMFLRFGLILGQLGLAGIFGKRPPPASSLLKLTRNSFRDGDFSSYSSAHHRILH